MGRKKKKELDKLSLDMIECEKAGFGVHYGRWKATQEPVKKIPVVIPEGWKACEFCGKPFKRNHAQRFCDLYCRNKAYKEKEKQIKAEYMRGHQERKLAETVGQTVMENKERPWVDARTYRRELEVRKLTAKDVIDAVEKMKQIPVSDFYFFCTDWVTPYVSEEECIQYFADNGSVIVIDHQGRKWRRGILIPDSY